MPRVAVAVLLVLILTGGRAQSPPAAPMAQRLEEAERLAWLKNWLRAEPIFVELEEYYRSQADERNALFATVSRMRGQLPRLSLLQASTDLAEILESSITKADDRLRLRVLVVKGDVDLDLDAGLAERDWTEALGLARKLGDKGWEHRATGELGIIAFLLGDTGGGASKVQSALKAARESGDVAAQVRYLTVFGSGLSYMRNHEGAARNFRDAIAIAEANPEMGFPFLTYSHMAAALVRSGQQVRAQELLRRIVDRAREIRSSGYEAEALLDLGRIAVKQKEPDEAAAYFSKAADLAESVDGHRLLASAEHELSKLASSEGRHPESLQHASVALEAAENSGDIYHLPAYFSQLAVSQLANGDVPAALTTYDRAADIIEAMLPNVASPTSKATLIGNLNDLIVGHVQLLAGKASDPVRAHRVLETARGRSLADALRAPRPHVSAEWATAQKRISRLQLQLLKARKPAVRRRLLDDLQSLEEQMSPAATAGHRPMMRFTRQPLSIRAVQAALAPSEAILEYVIADPESLCFVLTRDDFKIRRLGSAQKITELARAFDAAIRSGKDESEAAALYDAVLEPVGGVAKRQRLIIVPDGPLYRVPFDALVRGGRRLNDSVDVAYAPSATVLAILRSRPAGVGDIPFIGLGVGPERTGSGTGIQRGVYDAEISALPDLQAASEEATTIGRMFGRRAITLIGDDATESALKRRSAHRTRVLHFAAHAVTSTKYPDRSALILRPEKASSEDGLLQSREIAQMRLSADLVTLSACETGDGKVLGQEGIANLARPFLMAGAKSVVASLWTVDDEFTRAIMQEFYKQLTVDRHDKARALAEAKRAIRRKFAAQASTRLWAGFVLIGDDRGKLRRVQ